MGHGVSTPLLPPQHYHQKFLDVERKCNSGHYQTDLLEYQKAIKSAISCEALDFLEVLLVGGPAKKAYPVHLAASLGKLEPLELMLGAGFPGFTKDSNGNTPLHCTSECVDDLEAAALCAAALCLHYPNLHKTYNSQGLTALQLSAKRDNLNVFQAIWQSGGDAKQLTMKGESLKQICEQNEAYNVLNHLSNSTKSSSSGKNGGNNAHGSYFSPIKKEVDMDRIMQVWDRFFENAMLSAERNRLPYPAPKSSKSKAKAKTDKKNKSDKYCDNLMYAESKTSKYSANDYDGNMYETKQMSNTFNNITIKDSSKQVGIDVYSDNQSERDEGLYAECLDWLSYIMAVKNNETIVIDKRTFVPYPVQDFASYIEQSYYYLVYTEDSEYLPKNLMECVQQRYLSYYNMESDNYDWIHLYTFQTLPTLPIGYDAFLSHPYGDPALLNSLELYSYDEVEYYPIQCQGWVLVLLEEDEGHYSSRRKQATQTFYFYSRLTEESSWIEPKEYTEQQADWRLCCMENNPTQYFYYNTCTGESSWT